MTEVLFLDWVKQIWEPYAKAFPRTLLILDEFSVHKMESVKSTMTKLNTDLLYIPSGMTSKLQPLDIFVNKPLKTFMSKKWDNFVEFYSLKNAPSNLIFEKI